MKRKKVCKAVVCCVLLALSQSLIAQQGAKADSRPAAGEDALFPEADYGVTMNPGIGFAMDPLKLFTVRVDPAIVFYGNYFGDTQTQFWVQTDVQYGNGYWFYSPDGTRVDPNGSDGIKGTWRQVNLFGNLIFRQGLIPGSDLQDPDVLMFVAEYSARYYGKLKDQSPDAYIFDIDREDSGRHVYQNRLLTGFEFRKYSSNKLFNTRKGTSGDVTFEAVPRKFGNDILGLADFYRLSANVRNYIPITQGRTFSMYVHEALSYDIGWGDFMPMSDAYGSANACPVRGSFLYDAKAHLSHNLELRMSFPDLIDFGAMPGFNAFYDCGVFDDYNYKFSPDNFRHAVGTSFVLHMDSSAITPVSYQLDLQFGITYDISNDMPAFWFSVFFPGSESQM